METSKTFTDKPTPKDFLDLQAEVRALRMLSFALVASMPSPTRQAVLQGTRELGAGLLAYGLGRGTASTDPVFLEMHDSLDALYAELEELHQDRKRFD